MNSYERTFRRMQGERVDRLPNQCLLMTFAAKQIGVPYGQYVTDYKLLTEGVLKCYEKFRLDLLCAISDPMREAEGLGAKVIIPEDSVPYCEEFRLKSLSDVSTLKTVDPASSRRMNDRLEAVRILSEKAKKEVPVIGWVEGSVAEACDLMNISDMMMCFLDEPEGVNELLEVCLEQSSRFAISQIKAGADIIGIGDAAASLIGHDLFEEFALPYQQRLIKVIHDAGAKAKLHICGNVNAVLDLIAISGADIVDLDHMVDMEKAALIFPETISIGGNMDPVEIVLRGTPATVDEAVKKSMQIADKNYSIMAAGCEIPKETPEENLMQVYKTLCERSA